MFSQQVIEPFCILNGKHLMGGINVFDALWKM